MRASSRRSSSELGAWIHSARLPSVYSRPMTGVTSKLAKESRTPVLFTQGFPGVVVVAVVEVAASSFPGWMGISAWAGSTSVAEGAMVDSNT